MGRRPPLGQALLDLVAKISDPAVAAVLVVVVVVAIVVATAFAGNAVGAVLLGVVALAAILFVGWTRFERGRVGGASAVDLNDTVGLAASLDDADRNEISRALANASAEAAAVVGVPADRVRANLFGVSPDNKLSVLPGLSHHMDREDELGLKLDPGLGSTGLAFSNAEPNIAVLRTNWGSATIPEDLLSKIHPDLRWIVSVPVFAEATPRPMWILNVDGLGDAAEVDRLQAVVSKLAFYAQAIAVIVARATSDMKGT